MMKKRRFPVIIALLLLYFMLNYIPKYSTAESMFVNKCMATFKDSGTGLCYNVFSDGIYIHDSEFCCVISDGNIVSFDSFYSHDSDEDLKLIEAKENHVSEFESHAKELEARLNKK